MVFQRHKSQSNLFSSRTNSSNPIAELYFEDRSESQSTCSSRKCKLFFDGRIGVLPVSQGPGLRFEDIFLRRSTMTKTITTNKTPAIIRTVVGSIEALSLVICGTILKTGNAACYKLRTDWRTERATQKYVEKPASSKRKPNVRRHLCNISSVSTGAVRS
jgi:hypothetical protein